MSAGSRSLPAQQIQDMETLLSTSLNACPACVQASLPFFSDAMGTHGSSVHTCGISRLSKAD